MADLLMPLTEGLGRAWSCMWQPKHSSVGFVMVPVPGDEEPGAEEEEGEDGGGEGDPDGKVGHESAEEEHEGVGHCQGEEDAGQEGEEGHDARGEPNHPVGHDGVDESDDEEDRQERQGACRRGSDKERSLSLLNNATRDCSASH